EGSTFRYVDGTASADPDRELEVPFANPFLAVPHLFPGGVGDQVFRVADLPPGELLLDRLAGDLDRVLVRDDQGLLSKLEGLADLSDREEGVVADDDVPRKLHRLRFVERLCIQRADGGRLRTASKEVSVLNSDDLDGRIVRECSHPRPSPRNL